MDADAVVIDVAAMAAENT
uniref:Uncharacterized protein n=1 Tax=Arundo donax TaxID=35708 RepID=A0A0A9LM99_ARUDO